MKMPRRPFFPGTFKPRPDIFGLHHLTLLDKACESETERQKRASTVEKGVHTAFKAAVVHLGEDEARKLFMRVTRRPKRGKGKAHAADRDARLLREYDVAVRAGESVTALAKRLHATCGQQLGNTPCAIQTQIRKLVRERRARDHDSKKQARFWRMATRGEKTLADGFIREK